MSGPKRAVAPAVVGQVWEERATTHARVRRAKSQGPSTLTITETSSSRGGFCHGIRQPSGRKVRVRLDEYARPRGYVLKQGFGTPLLLGTTQHPVRYYDTPEAVEADYPGASRIFKQPPRQTQVSIQERKRSPLEGLDDEAKRRIKAISVAMVAKQIQDGDVDPEDKAAMRQAVAEAVETARAAYVAALEFLS